MSRMSMGSQNTDIVGSCLLCGSSFDDYSPRCRCTYCRMLVLVCDGCQMQENAVYVCELCQKRGKKDGVASLLADAQFISGSSSDLTVDAELGSVPTSIGVTPLHEVHGRNGNRHSGKLRILCLHGFRQNASSFKGRTASLAKKLKSMAEFVFVDGLHELPFIYQPRPGNPDHDSTRCSLQHQSTQENYKKRFAWLISSISDHNKVPQDWKILEQPFDPNQYQQQTNGFEESYAYLKNIFSQMGPFDGILGFSQGAAMVAMVCQQQQRRGGIPDFSRGNDRQIAWKASKELASLFDAGCSVIIEHEMGHIIPARPPYIDQMKTFLQRFT